MPATAPTADDPVVPLSPTEMLQVGDIIQGVYRAPIQTVEVVVTAEMVAVLYPTTPPLTADEIAQLRALIK